MRTRPGWSGSLPATGWSSSGAEPLGERDVLGPGDVLVAEEQHLVLQQQRLELGEQVVVAGGVGQVDVAQLGADVDGQRCDLDAIGADVVLGHRLRRWCR